MSDAPQSTAADIAEIFAGARARQAEGDLAEAKRRYGQILTKIPHHAESMTLLASIAYQEGDDLQAKAYIDRAIHVYSAVLERMPGLTHVRAPLINLLQAEGRIEEAERYMEGLELKINPIRASVKEYTRRRRYGIERGIPAILMTTVPKSASESIWNRLAEGLTMAQGHLSLGLFPDCLLVPIRIGAAAEGGLIAKEHLCATPFNIKALADGGLTRVVCNLRDPRQATLSWAHFVRDDVSMRLLAPIYRKIVPPSDVYKQDFAVLLDWCIDNYLPYLIAFAESWTRADEDPECPISALFLSFEAYQSEPERYCEAVLDFYGIDHQFFDASRESEVVHLRKGQSEEWRQVLSAEQQARAYDLIPKDMAERFGWQA